MIFQLISVIVDLLVAAVGLLVRAVAFIVSGIFGIIQRQTQKNNKFRTLCGECSYATSWLPESQAQTTMVRHYSKHHPGIPASGLIEFR
jgi:hypothetical protein